MKVYFWDKKSLSYSVLSRNLSIKIIFFLTILITTFTILVYNYGFNKGIKSEIMEKDIIMIYNETENSSFTKRKFYDYLKEVNIRFPELVFAQAIKESGLKSHIFKLNHNPFGMKEASKRPNKQNGSQFNHAYYNTWKDAVIDYAMYQSFVGLSKLKTEQEYLNFLKEMNYYDVDHPANVDYLKDLKKIRDNIDNYLD